MSITCNSKKARVGIMICGHKEYWPQFPGAKEAIMDGAKKFEKMVSDNNVDVVVTGMVDTVEASYKAGMIFKKNDIDLLFVYLHTYVASGRWVPGIVNLNVPVVLVALSKKFDFDSKTIEIAHVIKDGSPCQLPEAYSALLRTGKEPADVLFGGFENDSRIRKTISEWCSVAKILRTYKGCVIGYLGHSYDGMLDMNSDPTAFTGAFGVYIKMLEMCELVDYVNNTTDEEVDDKIREMEEIFDFVDASYDPTTKDIVQEDIVWAAKCAVGLDKLVSSHNLSGLAYYYEGLANTYERVASNLIIGNTLLTRKGISLAGEADLKTCLAMKTTSAIGAGGSFCELCIVDFDKDLVFIGHDGPHDIRISNARPVIRGLGLYHGKKGYGISVEYSIRHGDITMVSLATDANNKFKFVVAEGQSVEGNVPEIGNTLTRGYFGKNVSKFIEDWTKAGPPHHASLCVGHVGSVIQKLGKALKVDVEIVRSGGVD
ncbi:MAG TPA: arabinose isomerase [Clostridiaceae bacterium]|nr:arabinose isomerase [Clostridiaceae bacterium]